MKKLLLIITLLCVVIVSNSYNYGNISAYYNKTLEIMYDSKKRPHKIVIYSGYKYGMTAIDLDADTYINK